MVEHMISAIEREYMKTVPTAYDDLEAKKALHKFLQVSGRLDTLEYAEAECALLTEPSIGQPLSPSATETSPSAIYAVFVRIPARRSARRR